MNNKIIKFTELCLKSRTKGLTKEKHLKKINLANELVNDGLMTNNGMYNFVNEEDIKYFEDIMKDT